jgi:hypothetical protein
MILKILRCLDQPTYLSTKEMYIEECLSMSHFLFNFRMDVLLIINLFVCSASCSSLLVRWPTEYVFPGLDLARLDFLYQSPAEDHNYPHLTESFHDLPLDSWCSIPMERLRWSFESDRLSPCVLQELLRFLHPLSGRKCGRFRTLGFQNVEGVSPL